MSGKASRADILQYYRQMNGNPDIGYYEAVPTRRCPTCGGRGSILGEETRGATNRDKTECPKGHPYTPENTYYRPSTGWRECKTCRTEYRKRKQQEKEDQ